jgi:hypothetical protein
MLAAAEATDVQEDEIFGKDKRGDEMPDWASDREKRLAKIQEAMAALEADAKLAAEEERRIEAEKQQQRNAEGRKKPGKLAAPLALSALSTSAPARSLRRCVILRGPLPYSRVEVKTQAGPLPACCDNAGCPGLRDRRIIHVRTGAHHARRHSRELK